MEILNLEKWNFQTIESVKHVLDKAQAPCVGFSLVFMDFQDKDTVVWKYKTYLAFDPENPPTPEEREKIEAIFADRAHQIKVLFDDRDLDS
jgi:hypothetical protein